MECRAVTTDEGVRLEIASEPRHCAKVRTAVKRVAERAGLTEPALTCVTLAVDEAITNIIRHGYDGRRDQPIEVEVRPASHDGKKCIEFYLRDRGRQVEPNEIQGRELSDVRPGGLGTHIIRTVMDVVEYSKRDAGGMQLHLVKYLEPCTAPGADGPRGDVS